MDLIISCALVSMLLPYFAKIPVIVEMNKLGGYNNKQPRAQQHQLSGKGARAVAAHYNCFESLAVFAVALAVVFGTNSITSTIQWLALTHIIARVLYCVFYWFDLDILRSTTWLLGVACPIAMVVLSF
ncbi:MAPEG family protein [Pseudoalteromonas luteoviolacea]|uniref:MAPEG family protein n=1 Tax=Pseudoalteromonas luteoviolacea TaxID=43657 RepID=UPI001B37222C|nr:MAPEG family protein [Pseudoalteromonas luteoviolacea]MBQ4812766.1 MAPEG family protein [Pseudoalteromonas luteoviolacea]